MINFWIFTWVVVPIAVVAIGLGAVLLSRYDAGRVDRARHAATEARRDVRGMLVEEMDRQEASVQESKVAKPVEGTTVDTINFSRFSDIPLIKLADFKFPLPPFEDAVKPVIRSDYWQSIAEIDHDHVAGSETNLTVKMSLAADKILNLSLSPADLRNLTKVEIESLKQSAKIGLSETGLNPDVLWSDEMITGTDYEKLVVITEAVGQLARARAAQRTAS